jgi:hypothetical protein
MFLPLLPHHLQSLWDVKVAILVLLIIHVSTDSAWTFAILESAVITLIVERLLIGHYALVRQERLVIPL